MPPRTGHIARRMALATLFACAVVSVLPAQTSTEPLHGVVWTPPSAFSEMREELETMSDFGIRAVRVDLVLDESVQLVTDMFGIKLFQEVDLAFSPANVDPDRLEFLSARLDSALEVASQAGGLTYLGLGYWNDTSDERMCQVISSLSDRAHSTTSQIRTYYTTPFIEHDRCSDVVDFVLLDSRSGIDPVDLLTRWEAVHKTPAGVAALGSPVYPGADSGYRVADSPESQARRIESALRQLNHDTNVVAVFVDRWIERDPRRLNSVGIDGDFGILRPDGTERPAAEVVKGFYTGDQEVFAFPAGSPGTVDFSWVNLLAFLVAALFGLTYYTSLDMRSLLRRYFMSHSFYLEKVGDGRDISIGVSLFLLACLSILASIVGMTIVTLIQGTNFWYALTRMLPDFLSWSLRAGARHPGILMLAFATIFALVALIWSAGLSIVTRGSKNLGPGQTLLLVVMPRWPIAIFGLLVLVILNWQIDAPIMIVSLVSGIWLVLAVGYTGRMFSDYLRLLGISALLTIPVILLGLMILGASVWLIVVTQGLTPDLGFLWNLAKFA